MALLGIITSAVVVVLSIVELVFLIMGSEEVEPRGSGSSGGRHSPAIENTVSPAVETSAPARADAARCRLVDSRVGRLPSPIRCPGWGRGLQRQVRAVLGAAQRGDLRHCDPSRWGLPRGRPLLEQADESCTAEFESFVGLPYEESALSQLSDTERGELGPPATARSLHGLRPGPATRPERSSTPTAKTLPVAPRGRAGGRRDGASLGCQARAVPSLPCPGLPTVRTPRAPHRAADRTHPRCGPDPGHSRDSGSRCPPRSSCQTGQ